MIPQEVDNHFSSWQKRVVLPKKQRTKNIEVAQARLAEVVRGGSRALVEYLLAELGLDGTLSYDAPMLPRCLTAGEAGDPPPQLEVEIADAFSGANLRDNAHPVTPAQAIRPVFWTISHVQWLKNGFLEKDWVRGLERNNDDSTARNVCRKLGGLQHIRGRISVLRDCPISRAWWRVRIAKRVAEVSEGQLTVENAHSTLRPSASWEEIIGGCVKNVAVINEPRALAAICTNIHNNFRIAPPKNYARDIARGLARHSNVLSLHVTPFEELLRICEEVSIDFYAKDVAPDEAEQDEEASEY